MEADRTQAPLQFGGTSSVAFGTEHPIVLVDYDASERWLVACQARRDTNGDGQIASFATIHGHVFGDRVVPYLMRRGHADEAIDAFVGSTGDGRFVAYVARRRLWLVDAETDQRRPLGTVFVDENAWAGPGAPSPHGSFDASGRYFLQRTKEGPNTGLRVHSLLDGRVETVDLGAKRLFFARLTNGGRFLHLALLASDARRPSLRTTLADGQCVSPATYSTYGMRGPGPDQFLIDLSEDDRTPIPIQGILVDRPDLLMTREGEQLIERTETGRSDYGSVPSGADVVAIDPAGHRLMIVQRGERDEPDTYSLVDANGIRPVDAGHARFDRHDVSVGDVACGSRLSEALDQESYCLRLSTGTRVDIPRDSEAVAVLESRTFFVHRNALYVLESGSHEPRLVLDSLQDTPVRHGDYLTIDRVVVGLRESRVVGLFDRAPMVIGTLGHALTVSRAATRFDFDVRESEPEESAMRTRYGTDRPLSHGPAMWIAPLAVMPRDARGCDADR